MISPILLCKSRRDYIHFNHVTLAVIDDRLGGIEMGGFSIYYGALFERFVTTVEVDGVHGSASLKTVICARPVYASQPVSHDGLPPFPAIQPAPRAIQGEAS
jgi:hypothetical protein